jgi:tRNA(adenine34) deaminase
MCLGAAVQARLKRIVFGTLDPKGGAVRSIMRFPVKRTNHDLRIEGGILAGECSLIMKNFFASKRK